MRDAQRRVRGWCASGLARGGSSTTRPSLGPSDDDEEGATPDPLPTEEDEAPCPERDRPPGDDPQPPCDESEEQEFARLAKQLLGASTEDVAAALLKLAERRGCGSPKRFCMSRHGQALGVCENQELWQRMCEAMGWTDDPPVLRTVQ